MEKPSLLLILFLLASCHKEPAPQPPNTLRFNMVSELTMQTMQVDLPNCFMTKSEITNNEITNRVSILIPETAITQSIINTHSPCPSSKPINMTINPISKIWFNEVNQDIYEYIKYVHSKWQLESIIPSTHNGTKNFMQLSSSVNGDVIYIDKNHPKSSHPLRITFTPYSTKMDPISGISEKKDDFTLYFKTIIHNEFVLYYDINITDDASSTMKQFKDIIRKNESILDHPEIIDYFIASNEIIVGYFEENATMLPQ